MSDSFDLEKRNKILDVLSSVWLTDLRSQSNREMVADLLTKELFGDKEGYLNNTAYGDNPITPAEQPTWDAEKFKAPPKPPQKKRVTQPRGPKPIKVVEVETKTKEIEVDDRTEVKVDASVKTVKTNKKPKTRKNRINTRKSKTSLREKSFRNLKKTSLKGKTNDIS